MAGLNVLMAASVLPALTSVGAAVVVLGLLIFAHELGHFVVAKLSGVGVLKFSLGFGRKVAGWKLGETEYMVSVFPLGGYIKMLGEDGEPEDEPLTPEQKARSFMAQPIYKRAAIIFAGPVFNILLAFLLLYLLFIVGYPTAVAKVAGVAPGSPAAAAGFKAGDIIEAVDKKDIDFWEQVEDYAAGRPGRKITFSVRRDGRLLDVEAVPADAGGKGRLGLRGSVVVAAVMVGSPADKAGINSKDRILAVDWVEVGSWGEMADKVREGLGKRLVFTVERGGRVFDAGVVPIPNTQEKDPKKRGGMVGIVRGDELMDVSCGPVEAIGKSALMTRLMTGTIVVSIARLIKGKEDATQMGGPGAIVQLSGRQARQGFAEFVMFMAFLSVNLGVINLFPIPILDGGHLFFLCIEAVMGRPLGMRKREIAQQVGLVILIALLVFVTRNDIMRWLGYLPTWK